ncbi:hypothetical protein ACFL0C_02475 [Patescibacteria group bacterium]
MFSLLEETLHANTNLLWSTLSKLSLSIYSSAFLIWSLMTFSLVVIILFYFLSHKFKNYYDNKLKSSKKLFVVFYFLSGILILSYRFDSLIYDKFFVRKMVIGWDKLEKVMLNCEIKGCGRNTDGYGNSIDEYIYCEINNSRHKYKIKEMPSKNIFDLIDKTKENCEIQTYWDWVD